MLNNAQKPKNKGVIKDATKLQQVYKWKQSLFFNAPSHVHQKKKASFDSITEFLDNCINFHKTEIELMLNSGIDIDCADKDNLTALHQACINGKIDLVIYLLDKKANINAVDKEGWTSLHIAASIGSLELTKCLVDRGAKLEMTNYEGDLPVSLVNEAEHPDLKKYLQLEMKIRDIDEEKCRSIERIVMMEDIFQWKSSRSYNPPIDAINKSTPLHVAACKNYIEVLKAIIPLLSAHDLNAQDSDGWTALHAASHFGNIEAFMILMRAGVNPDIVTHFNETFLDTVDPIIQVALEKELNNFKIECQRDFENPQQISIRNDNANKRRTSIARQSVEWKKNNQSKDPELERMFLSTVNIDPDSSDVTSPVEDSKSRSNKMFKVKECGSISEMDEGSTDQTLSQDIHDEPTETYSNVTFTSASSNNAEDKLKKELIPTNNKHFNETSVEVKDCSPRLSDGDNVVDPIETIEQCNIKVCSDINNGAYCDISDNSIGSSGSEKGKIKEEGGVQMRPKSDRDSIQKHRTESRVSLLVAPEKCVESETSRREKARRVRSNRRSTQAINLGKSTDHKEDESESSLPIPTPSADSNANKDDKNEHNESIPKSSTDSTDTSTMDIRSPAPFTKVNHPGTPRPLTIKRDDSFKLIAARGHIGRQLSSLMKSNPSNNNTDQTNLTPTFKIPFPAQGSKKLGTCAEETVSEIRNPAISNINRHSAQKATEEIVSDSGSFVAKHVLGPNRIRENDFSYPSNKQNRHVESPSTTKVNDQSPIDDNKTCAAIATRLANDQTVKQELRMEVSKLKQEIQDLKNVQNSKNEQTERYSDDDKLSKLEIELLKTKEENKKLKLQNEALLRVISKIQQDLESFQVVPKNE